MGDRDKDAPLSSQALFVRARNKAQRLMTERDLETEKRFAKFVLDAILHELGNIDNWAPNKLATVEIFEHRYLYDYPLLSAHRAPAVQAMLKTEFPSCVCNVRIDGVVGLVVTMWHKNDAKDAVKPEAAPVDK
jgi:hypothetical protein